MATFAKALQVATKSLPFPGFGGGYSGWLGSSLGSRYPIFRGLPGERDWGALVGDGSGNSIVEACVLWICRNFPQAPMIVVEEGTDGIPQKVLGHALPKLWKRPNPYFSGTLLWYGVLASFIVNGNGYLMKRRNQSGRVAEVWYVPHFMLQPRWYNKDSFIDWYDYIVDGQRYPVPVEDIYHLRYGIDPTNIRLGRSPLGTLLKELGIDEEASRFSAAILHNLGVPGIVIAPDKDQRGELDSAKRDEIKMKFKQSFGGDNRGDPIVMSKPTNIMQFGFSPNELDLSQIRDVPEERVTAVLGIPASVVGFQQQNSKVGATRAEERDQAFENCIIPTQGIAADEMTIQVLPEFTKNETELERQEVMFDLSRVRVLLDAQNKMAERQATLARAGIAKRKEVRSAMGLPTSDEDDVYIPSPGVQVMEPDGTIINLDPGAQMLGAGKPKPQLALPSGKEFQDEIDKKAAQRDALLMEGFAAIGKAIIEASSMKGGNSQPSGQGFKVLRDESGRLAGIVREVDVTKEKN
jgi:HK97 family phage portal protein